MQCQQAAAIQRLSSSAVCTPADADVLAAALEELHQHQQSIHFQAVLAQEAAKAAKSTWSVRCSCCDVLQPELQWRAAG